MLCAMRWQSFVAEPTSLLEHCERAPRAGAVRDVPVRLREAGCVRASLRATSRQARSCRRPGAAEPPSSAPRAPPGAARDDSAPDRPQGASQREAGQRNEPDKTNVSPTNTHPPDELSRVCRRTAASRVGGFACGAGTGCLRIESGPMKIAVCVKQVPDATVHKKIDPADEAARPLGRGGADPDRPERGRGGAADQGGARRRGRPRLASARRRPSSRCGRRSRWAPTARC